LFTTFQNKSVFFIKYQKEIVLLSGLISTLMVVFTLLSLNRVMIIYLEAEGRPDILKLMILPIGLIFIIAGLTQEK
jgi:spore germination protein GerM